MKKFLLIFMLTGVSLFAATTRGLLKQANEAFYAKDYQKAAEILTRALQIADKRIHFRIYNNRGVAYKNLKAYDKAMNDFLMAVRLAPRYTNAYNNIGTLYLRRKEYARAIEIFDQVLQMKPHHFSALYNIACVHSLENRKSAAVKYLIRARRALIRQGRSLQILYMEAKRDPDLRNLKGYPPFEKLMRQIEKRLSIQHT